MQEAVDWCVQCFHSTPLYTPNCLCLLMSIDHPIRISLDVSRGTFSRIEEICGVEYRDKASYLRMLLNEDFIKREKGESDK